MPKNFSIQVLRGIAILGVIAFHIKTDLAPNGYLGVDLFFLISGYLIIPRIKDAILENRIKSFYLRRFNRLAPAVIFTLAVMTPLVLILGSWNSHQYFAFQALWTLFMLGNFGAVVISGDYFNPDSFTPLVHTWSLSVEEQAYILLPLLMRVSKYLIFFASGISLLIFLFQGLLPASANEFLFYMVISRIWEFHLGYLFHKLNIRKLKKNPLFSSILLISLITAIFSPVSTPRIASTLFVLFISGTLISLKMRDIAIFKILQVIGDRSYSLYLFHMPLLYLAKFTPLLYGDQREVPTMFAVVLTFLLAEISYRKVEFRFSRRAS